MPAVLFTITWESIQAFGDEFEFFLKSEIGYVTKSEFLWEVSRDTDGLDADKDVTFWIKS